MPGRNQHYSCHLKKLTHLVFLRSRFGFSARSQPCEIRHDVLQQVSASDCSCQPLCPPKDTNSKHALPEDVGHRCQCSHSSEDAARLSNMNIVPVCKVRPCSRGNESKETVPFRLHPFGSRTGIAPVARKQFCRPLHWQVHSPYA